MRVIYLILWGAVLASATTLYTTNDANDNQNGTPCGSPLTYNCINANAIGPAEDFTGMSESFTPSVTANLGQIDLPADAISGTGNLLVEITSNSAGKPGSVIESLNKSVSKTASIVTLPSLLHPQLTAGTTYWIIVTTSGTLNVNWFVASDLNSRNADFLNGSTWTNVPGSTKGSVEIDSATPEPSAAAFAALGISLVLIRGMIGGMRRR